MLKFCQKVYLFLAYISLGPVKPKKIVHILPTNGPDDLYTIQNRNPKLQPNWPAQFLQQALAYLKIQVGQAGQSLWEKFEQADLAANFKFLFCMV